MTTILIWNNRKTHIGGHSYMGHASMNIDDNWKWGIASHLSYVSFWPSSASDLHTKSVSSTSSPTVTSDISTEGYAPDHILKLSGLDMGAMTSEWKNIRAARKNYQALRRNCSSTVATVLKKGTSLGSFKRRHSAIWTPLNVKRFALDIGAKTIMWSAFLAELVQGSSINMAEASVLNELGKRDEAHGSSTTSAYFSNGARIMEKQRFSTDRANGFNFTGGGSTPGAGQQIPSLMAVSGGTLFQQGQFIAAMGDDD